ncbi:MAG: DUF192 domain-containing protein [Nitrosomonas sp.]|nr:MAG: DUF192 domain-containing protein [Nitrosomonas sp.]
MIKRFWRQPVAIVWGLLAAIPAFAQTEPQPRLPTVELTIGMYVIQAEVAQTHQQHGTGLMHRQKLGVNEGMLFMYNASEIRCYWMRNTLIPLTIAFIDDTEMIVNLKDMKPHSERSHCSLKPVRYALEMNQGWFAQRGIKPGFKVRGLPVAPAGIQF